MCVGATRRVAKGEGGSDAGRARGLRVMSSLLFAYARLKMETERSALAHASLEPSGEKRTRQTASE